MGGARLFCLFAFLSCAVSLFSQQVPGQLTFTNYIRLADFGLADVADFNRDGLLDVFSSTRSRIFHNTGTNFSNLPYRESGTWGMPVELGDFDGDNSVDIYTAWPTYTSSGSIRSNHFAISWSSTSRDTNTSSPFLPSFYGASSSVDFDNDGDLDLLVTGRTNAEISRGVTRLYENLGSRQFLRHDTSLPVLERSVMTWSDYDQDGDMDLFFCGRTNLNETPMAFLYRNDAGALTNSGLSFPRLDSGSASWGDYDSDNDLDLLLTGYTNSRVHAVIYRNDDGAFTPVAFGPATFTSPPASCWADFDADGDLDIILAQPYQGPVRLYINEGNDTFASPRSISIAAGQMIPAELNNDGRLDIVVHNIDSWIQTTLNVSARSNSPPNAPTNLMAIPLDNGVEFTWDAAVDLEQTNGLTYNLRIGTAPGKSDIMSAMANPTNGVRSVARLGNTGLRRSWTIRNLSVGTYYWSVQAIDSGLRASSFAAEQSFTLATAPPSGRVVSIWNVTPVGAVVGTRVNPNNAATAYCLEISSSNRVTGSTESREVEAGTSDIISNFRLTGLAPSTRYEVRLVATNAFGIYRSSPTVFVTATNTAVTEFPGPFPVLAANPSFLPMDLDQDGDMDVVASGAGNNFTVSTRTFLNEGGVFSEGASIPHPQFTQANAGVVATADFNNDALLDLVMGNNYDTMLLLQSTNRTFIARRMSHEIRPYQLFPGDADNDGDIDIVSTFSFPLFSLGVYANDNIDFFRGSSVRFDRGQFAEWGDYDNDGDNDLLVWGVTNDSISHGNAITRIFRSEPDRHFTNIHAGLPGTINGASWSDYDNDGDLDIALITGPIAYSGVTNELRLYRNEQTNGFISVETILSDRGLLFPQWVDFDRDGRSDLFVQQDLTGADRIRLFLNKEDHFTEQNLGLPLLTNIQSKFADIDGDLMPDLLLNVQATNYSQRLRVFRNNLTSTNLPPPVPLNLTSVVAQMSATLHWEPPSGSMTETETHAPVYSYNLRIGKTPGGSEIMSAMSDPVTGSRFVPTRGNAGRARSWRIRDLLPGTYYWSVQSVDHALNGSRFSAEASFTIAPYERTPSILSLTTIGTNLTHQLTIEGPTRSRAQIHHSADLQSWSTNTSYIYIGDEPTTFSTGRGDTRFYRFQLLP